jgi:hypothetical protein
MSVRAWPERGNWLCSHVRAYLSHQTNLSKIFILLISRKGRERWAAPNLDSPALSLCQRNLNNS